MLEKPKSKENFLPALRRHCSQCVVYLPFGVPPLQFLRSGSKIRNTRTKCIWTMGAPATGNCTSIQILQRHLLWQQKIIFLCFSRFFWNSMTEMEVFKKRADLLTCYLQLITITSISAICNSEQINFHRTSKWMNGSTLSHEYSYYIFHSL